MKFGLTTEQYHWFKKNIVEPLESSGAQVFCYGSRARGDFRELSDIDLMVEFSGEKELPFGDLKEKSENSFLPIKVDLVDFREYAEAYKSSYLKDKVPF